MEFLLISKENFHLFCLGFPTEHREILHLKEVMVDYIYLEYHRLIILSD